MGVQRGAVDMGVVIQEFGGKQHKQAIEKMLYNKNRKGVTIGI